MPTDINILFICNPETAGFYIETTLGKIGSIKRIIRVSTLSAAESIMQTQAVQTIIFDIEFQDENKQEFITRIRKQYPTAIIILFSPHVEVFSNIFQKIFGADFFIDISVGMHEIKNLFKEISKFQKSLVSGGPGISIIRQPNHQKQL